MKTYIKTIGRGVKKNFAKYISMIVIMLLGIAFVAGLGTLSPTIQDSINAQMNSDHFSDIIVKSTSPFGLSKQDISKLDNVEYIDEVEYLSSIDMVVEGINTRVLVYPDWDMNINKLQIEGEYPTNDREVMVGRMTDASISRSIGDTISVMGYDATIVGIVTSALMFDKMGEPNVINDEYLQDIIYIEQALIPNDIGMPNIPITDAYIRIVGMDDREYFGGGYLDKVHSTIDELQQELSPANTYLTVEENKSYMMISSYCDKINVITLIFPVFFIAVAALVVMTTISRMVEEERLQIGCLKSIGTSDTRVIFKYLTPTIVCSILAAGGGLAVGLLLLPHVIYPAFSSIFFMPVMSANINPFAGLMAFLAMAIVGIMVTIFVCRGTLKERPSALLVTKAPKAGKTIFLEKIPFVWKKMSFKFKSCFRNIFRYKKHLVMTIISVAGSTALVFAGIALLNVSDAMEGTIYAGLRDSMGSISAVVIVFALSLCMFVIYNLTNLNIGERKKEIATLDVLGYKKTEILGYIYREILIMATMGAVVGLGVGCGLIAFVLEYLKFGEFGDIQWYTYLSSIGLVLAMIIVTDILLIPKIIRIDMTASLKANE